jgi:hypothetical protein
MRNRAIQSQSARYWKGDHHSPLVALCYCRVERKETKSADVKRHLEIIAQNISKAGWSWGAVCQAVDSRGRTIFVPGLPQILCVLGGRLV